MNSLLMLVLSLPTYNDNLSACRWSVPPVISLGHVHHIAGAATSAYLEEVVVDINQRYIVSISHTLLFSPLLLL